MNKKQIVDGLIANARTAWSEDDCETLMNMDETVLAKMSPVVNEEPQEKEDPVQNAAEKGASGIAPKPVENTKPITTEEYIAAAPQEIRQVLRNSLNTYEQEKQKLITEITANEANAFTPEFLGTKDVAELKGIAALATNGKAKQEAGQVPMFLGQSIAQRATPIENAEGDDDVLALPVINFDESKAAKV